MGGGKTRGSCQMFVKVSVRFRTYPPPYHDETDNVDVRPRNFFVPNNNL